MNFRRTVIYLSMFTALMGGAVISHADNIGKSTYGVFTETYEGMQFNVKNTIDNAPGSVPDGAFLGAWGQAVLTDDVVVSTEGSKCLKAVVNGNGGWWAQFGYNPTAVPPNPRKMTDLGTYTGGSVDFMVKTPIDIIIKIEWGDIGYAQKRINADLGIPLDNKWHQVSIPLSSFPGIDLTRITVPAGFHTVPNTTYGTYWIDNVVWRKSGNGGLGATLRNVSDNAIATRITWTNVVPGETNWKAADQYLQLDLDYYNPNFGIQIYTDNKAFDASPRFTGTTDPAGLVDSFNSTKRLPMCWRVVDVSTTTLTIRENAAYHLYSQELPNSYFCWLYMKDKATAGFVNGDDYMTVWDRRGIQHGESSWGGALAPNCIYLGANFTAAISPGMYKTSKIIVELFYE